MYNKTDSKGSTGSTSRFPKKNFGSDGKFKKDFNSSSRRNSFGSNGQTFKRNFNSVGSEDRSTFKPRTSFSPNSDSRPNSYRRDSSSSDSNFKREYTPRSSTIPSFKKDFLTGSADRTIAPGNEIERKPFDRDNSRRSYSSSDSRSSYPKRTYNSSSSTGNSSYPRRDFSRSSDSSTSSSSSSSSSYPRRTYGSSSASTGGSYERRSYGNSSGGSRSYSSSRGGYGNRGGGQRRNRFEGQKIASSKYIAKAQPMEERVAYVPTTEFKDLNVDPILKAAILRKGYATPTEIQDKTILPILEGRDVIGTASTGSGKTAAFLIPLIDKILKDNTQKVLVVVPTRELANQIRDELFQLTNGMRIRSAVVIGGARMSTQLFILSKNPEFVIATPGRLKDLNNRNAINLSKFNNIVLDEVDRMLDMGFIDDIKFLVAKLPSKKQALFFSATMPREAHTIAAQFLDNPVKIEVESSQATNKNIEQNIVRVEGGKGKLDTLHDILIQEECKKVLIFTKTKHGSDRLSDDLNDRGFKSDAIHGDKAQNKRERVIAKFKANQINILVATDVAARGLDIKDITHVINYDEPANYEDYIHRIGRTGRAGKMGKALTFVS